MLSAKLRTLRLGKDMYALVFLVWKYSMDGVKKEL